MDRFEYAMKLHEKIAALDMDDEDRPPMLDMLLALDKADGNGMLEAYNRMSIDGKAWAQTIVEEFVNRMAQRRTK